MRVTAKINQEIFMTVAGLPSYRTASNKPQEINIYLVSVLALVVTNK